MKTTPLLTAALLAFTVSFISCRKELLAPQEEYDSVTAGQFIEGVDYYVENNILVFKDKEVFKDVLQTLSNQPESVLDSFEHANGFTSVRTYYNELNKFNLAETESPYRDPYFATVINPQGLVRVGDYYFKLVLEEQSVYAVPAASNALDKLIAGAPHLAIERFSIYESVLDSVANREVPCPSCPVEPRNCNASFGQVNDYGTLHFKNLSKYSSGIAKTFRWDFGHDMTVSAEENPVHTFPETGYYTICLRITDPQGCVDEFCKKLYVDVNVYEDYLGGSSASDNGECNWCLLKSEEKRRFTPYYTFSGTNYAGFYDVSYNSYGVYFSLTNMLKFMYNTHYHKYDVTEGVLGLTCFYDYRGRCQWENEGVRAIQPLVGYKRIDQQIYGDIVCMNRYYLKTKLYYKSLPDTAFHTYTVILDSNE